MGRGRLKSLSDEPDPLREAAHGHEARIAPTVHGKGVARTTTIEEELGAPLVSSLMMAAVSFLPILAR